MLENPVIRYINDIFPHNPIDSIQSIKNRELDGFTESGTANNS